MTLFIYLFIPPTIHLLLLLYDLRFFNSYQKLRKTFSSSEAEDLPSSY